MNVKTVLEEMRSLFALLKAAIIFIVAGLFAGIYMPANSVLIFLIAIIITKYLLPIKKIMSASTLGLIAAMAMPYSIIIIIFTRLIAINTWWDIILIAIIIMCVPAMAIVASVCYYARGITLKS